MNTSLPTHAKALTEAFAAAAVEKSQPPGARPNQIALRAGLVVVGLVAGFLLGTNHGRASGADYSAPGGGVPRSLPPRGDGGASAPSEDRSPVAEQAGHAFDLPPSARDVVINVGSSLDPIMPADAMGPCAHSLAVEPIVACRIPPHRRLTVLPAAVAGAPGVTSMRRYNKEGMSSSLATAAREGWWNNKRERGDGRLALVPVVTLSSILGAVPATARVALLKTDLQGFDFVAIREAAPVLKARVSHFFSEVWLDDVHSYDAENDFCRDWLPFMTELGYTFARMESDSDGPWNGTWSDGRKARRLCEEQLRRHPARPAVEASAGLREGDAFWVRNDALTVPFPDCPLLADAKHYTEEEYGSCGYPSEISVLENSN